MKSNKFWSFLMMFVIMLGSAIVFTSCGGDDDDDYNGGSGSSSGSGKITVALATNNVQTIKLHKTHPYKDMWTQGYEALDIGEQLIFYKDYNFKYGLCLYGNKLSIVPYALSNGNMCYVQALRNGARSGIVDLGKSNGINDIISVDKILGSGGFGETDSYYYYYSFVYPNHGYAIAFKTFEDGVKYMRVYVKSYTQQNDGDLTDITVEYQLFDPVVPKE